MNDDPRKVVLLATDSSSRSDGRSIVVAYAPNASKIHGNNLGPHLIRRLNDERRGVSTCYRDAFDSTTIVMPDKETKKAFNALFALQAGETVLEEERDDDSGSGKASDSDAGSVADENNPPAGIDAHHSTAEVPSAALSSLTIDGDHNNRTTEAGATSLKRRRESSSSKGSDGSTNQRSVKRNRMHQPSELASEPSTDPPATSDQTAAADISSVELDQQRKHVGVRPTGTTSETTAGQAINDGGADDDDDFDQPTEFFGDFEY
eukprot:GHVN01032979.1.p1 GENE.GHVN01032979.1~~GHVN01032979.1.p1  ORF type:complete len:263 (-),score=53.72 GHVN01032979.1:261-1049(-)